MTTPSASARVGRPARRRERCRLAPRATLGVALLLAALGALGAGCARRQGSTAPSPGALATGRHLGHTWAEIETADARLAAAFRDGDAVGAAGLFADDGVLLAAGAPAAVGRPAIERALAGLFRAARYRRVSLRVDDLRVDGSTAIELGTSRFEYEAAGGAGAAEGRRLVVWAWSEDVGWRITRAMTDARLPGAGRGGA